MPVMSAAPGRVQRAAYHVWLAVGVLVLIWLGWRVLARPVAVILPPIMLTLVIVYLCAPIVSVLADRGVPRWAGALVAYLGGLLTLALVLSVLVPMINEQLRTFAESLPDLLTKLGNDVNARLAPLGIDVPVGETIDANALSGSIERALEGGGLTAVFGVVGGLSGIALGVLQALVVFLLGPVIAFYVLVDLPRLGRRVRSLIPPDRRDEAVEVGLKLHDVVGGFIRGQLLVALFVGLATSIGLAAVGLPFWLLVGVTAGLTNVIPLVGPFAAGTLGVSIALVTDGVGRALIVLIVMLVVQQLDNQVISPLVMGRNVQLHPLAVLFALLVAGTTYGLLGLLIAVPTVAAANVLATHFWKTRVPWANDDDPGPEPPLATEGEVGPVAVSEPPVAEDGVAGPPAEPPRRARVPTSRTAGGLLKPGSTGARGGPQG
jgi:predicted PurR-regulated permease PerM